MKKAIRVFTQLILLPGGMLWGQTRDSVFLYNGQQLIGEIKYANFGVLQIDDHDLKLIKVKLYKIKRLSATGRFKIETVNRKVYYGQLQAGASPGWISVTEDKGAQTDININDLTTVLPLDKEFFKRLNGSIGAGLNYTKSSGVGLLNLNATVQYATRDWEFQFSAVENASIDSSTFSRDVENLQLFSNYNFTATYFAAGLVQYQRNLELSVSSRFQQMLGGGSKLFVKKTWQLMAISGLAVNQERSIGGSATNVLLEIPLMFRFNFFRFHHPNIQISSSQTAYFSLSDKGRVRVDTNTDFSWQLIRYFYFTVNPYSNYDSKPPAGSNNFDFGLVLGLSYKF